MNQALILILDEPLEGETEQRLIINSGGLDLTNQNHQRQALAMLRQAEGFLMDALLKPPCPDTSFGYADCEGDND